MSEHVDRRNPAALYAVSTRADTCEVFGQCDGPGDPLWPVHVEICRFAPQLDTVDSVDNDGLADIRREVLAEAEAAAWAVIDNYRREADDERLAAVLAARGYTGTVGGYRHRLVAPGDADP